jgi:AraC family ethanolamine operon transcriptional activator
VHSGAIQLARAQHSGRERIWSAPARHRQAQVAADFLHAYCREEVSVADLCVAAGASRRTLHLGFYEVFGSSPIEYLPALRLNEVRSELKESRGAGDAAGAVTRAAMNWVYSHLGYFSARYRAQFGEFPSETLRRYAFPLLILLAEHHSNEFSTKNHSALYSPRRTRS